MFKHISNKKERILKNSFFFMVCPPGLEPGPGASEALMVSNSTTGTFLFTSQHNPFSKVLLYFTLFRFHFASVYAILFSKK